MKVSFLLIIFLSVIVSKSLWTIRNPFSYGPLCTQTPCCEVVGFGRVRDLPVAVVSVNGVVQTLKIGDQVGTSSVIAFESEHIILRDFKNNTERTIALKKVPEEKEALQLKKAEGLGG
jgi:hypothetical protein